MLFADISLSTEAVAVIGVLLAALASAIAFMFRQVMAAKDERLSEMKSYKEIAAEAITALEAKVNEQRLAVGKQVFPPLASVVPEHKSPVTEKQQETADLATMRAQITAATLALGLPPRVAAPPESGSVAMDLKRVIAVDLKQEIDKVPAKTAEKVIEKLKDAEEKQS